MCDIGLTNLVVVPALVIISGNGLIGSIEPQDWEILLQTTFWLIRPADGPSNITRASLCPLAQFNQNPSCNFCAILLKN